MSNLAENCVMKLKNTLGLEVQRMDIQAMQLAQPTGFMDSLAPSATRLLHQILERNQLLAVCIQDLGVKTC